MKRKLTFISLIFCSILSGCGIFDADEYECLIINCNDTVSFEGIGTLKFAASFHQKPDQFYEKTEDCGFEPYKEEMLPYYVEAYQKCGGGVKLFFSIPNHGFVGVHLSKGWTGQTDQGLKIGDTLEQFKKIYPATEGGFESNDPWEILTSCLPDPDHMCMTMKVYFDSDNKVWYIIIVAG